jgi:hypothetical protein
MARSLCATLPPDAFLPPDGLFVLARLMLASVSALARADEALQRLIKRHVDM